MLQRQRRLLFAVSLSICCVLGLALSLFAGPGATERGDYFLRNFPPQEYGAFFQNWCVVQDRNGLVYVGNSSGVLEYDGARWRLIRTEKGSAVRSLAVDGSGRVFVGAIREFGCLAPDPQGTMRYVSFLERVPVAERPASEVLSVNCLGDEVYFQSFDRLYRMAGDQVTTWKPTQVFQQAFAANHRLYVQEKGRGLLVMDGGTLRPLPGGERFAEEKVRALLEWPTAGAQGRPLLVATQTQGLFLYDGHVAVPYPTQADETLREQQINHVLPLGDGTLAIATNMAGVVLLSRDGRWLGRIGKDGGLPVESVKWLCQDSQSGLWLALGYGISRVEIPAPATQFETRRGLPGAVVSIHRHRDTLYVGTDQGLFALLPSGPQGPRFTRVLGLKGGAWTSVSWDDQLLVANVDGLFTVRGTQARSLVRGTSIAYHIYRSRSEPRRLFIGWQIGLSSCLRMGDRWVDEGMVPGLPVQARSLAEAGDGSLWVGTAYHGVIHLSFPAGRRGAPRIERFGADRGLPPLSFTNVHWLSQGLRVSTRAGVYRFRPEKGRFEPDPAFAGLFPGAPRWVYALTEDAAGRIWMHSCDEASYRNESGAAIPQADGSYRWDGRACACFSGRWVESILREADGIVWFGTSEGLVRLDPGVAKQYDRPFHALVRAVQAGESRTVFGGAPAVPFPAPEIPFADRRLRFEFAAQSYDLADANRYQVMLEGTERKWSPWTAEPFRDFSNLPEGSYRFVVRARNGYGRLSEVGTFAFRIAPPWARTWWAYALWVLLGLAIIVGLVHLYTLKLRRQKRHLEQLVAERTRQLRDASLTDPLTGLRNRRFIQEVLATDISAFIGFKKHLLHARNERVSNVEHEVFGLFLVDIDLFKEVNDTYGHDAGDQVLKQFAAILKGLVRQDDVVMRTGGEEFLVVLKKTMPEYLPRFAAKVLERVAATPFQLGGDRTVRKTCSIGYTRFPVYAGAPGVLTFDQSAMIADLGLYHAKEHGRNQAVQLVAGPRLPENEEEARKAATSLEFATANGFLTVVEDPRRPPEVSGTANGTGH